MIRLSGLLQVSRNGPKHLLKPAFRTVYSSATDNAEISRPKVTIPHMRKLYRSKVPITVLTAHDYITGRVAESAGMDMVLVGDSLAMVAMGFPNTNKLTLDHMIYHTAAVSRGVKSSFLVADMPFGSYEKGPDHALDSAIRLVREGNAEAVKLEGGTEVAPAIKKLVDYGIPVVGHVGLTPQRQVSLGGFKAQGKTASAASKLLEDALAVQEAGCFSMVIEAVPDKVATLITEALRVPTIGIGAGPGTSGQVLVQLDMLGGFDGFVPKFLKRYGNMIHDHVAAVSSYGEDVRNGSFPAPEHCYTISNEEFQKLKELVPFKASTKESS